MHPEPLAHILEQGADIIVRTPWTGARWLGKDGMPFDILTALTAAENTGILDRPIWIGRKKAPPLALRLVALQKPPMAAEASRAKARQTAQRKGKAISGGTLAAAGWVILVTSLDAETFPARKIGELYRARWRIELAFKRLKLVPAKAGKPHRPLRAAS
jgi:IS4 transposase